MEQQGSLPEQEDSLFPTDDYKSSREADGARVSDSARNLALDLRKARTLADIRGVFAAHMGGRWSATEFFFAFFDRTQHRFLMLLEDGSLVPKPAANFALEHFLTNPGRTHAYAERLHTDLDLLGNLRILSSPEGLTVHSLAVPIERNGFLRGALGMFSAKVFEWDEKTVKQLRELGQTLLQASETSRKFGSAPRPTGSDALPSEEEWDRIRQLLCCHDVTRRILAAQLQPAEVVIAACRELGPLFSRQHFTIAVHYPESHLFVIHTPKGEPVRVVCDESIEGYFLYRRDEEILAVEDYTLWTAPPPLNLARCVSLEGFRSGLFAAGRVQNSLVAVIGLQSPEAVDWGRREVELLREVAAGFGLAFYHAMLSDNLSYSCREAHRQLEEARNEAQTWNRRTEQLETAAAIARAILPRTTLRELIGDLLERLGERWPDCRVTIQRYDREKGVFEYYPAKGSRAAEVRPVRGCVQNLFLNNVPVSHILCDTPQEISYYRDLDARLAEECEEEGYKSFCTAPIPIEGNVWGTITLQGKKALGPAAAELLAQIAQTVAVPIAATEIVERAHNPRNPA